MRNHIYNIALLEKILVVLALGFLLNSVLPNTYLEAKGFELEEYDEREKEADEEKKQHLNKDEFNSIFELVNDVISAYILEFYHRHRLKSTYKDYYFGVITPPPEIV